MLKFGMPTLIESATLEECAALCRTLGLDFIELNMNLPQYQPDTIDIERFRRIAKENGIFYTIHLDENLNVSDFNPYVADAYLRTVKESIALAKQLEAPLLNMHLSRGVYFTLPERKVYLFSEYREQYLRTIAAFRDVCEKTIGDAGIRISVENCSGWQDFQKEALELLLASPVFSLTLDIGHNHGSGGADETFILAHRDRLCHMHMHDALGKKDHMALGTGELELSRYLALAQESCRTVVLETKTVAGLCASVAWLRTHHPHSTVC
ncbi:MAG: sugar phosphate isomerase/epimerase [Clostridia bacterium]|nr:sugar phosphate isomerase/epimerase [Clostridia bacterium]